MASAFQAMETKDVSDGGGSSRKNEGGASEAEIFFLLLLPGLRSPDSKAGIFPMLFLGVRQWHTAGNPAVNTVTDSTGLVKGLGVSACCQSP